MPYAKAAPEEAGDAWTFTALDSESKLIVSYLTGPRDAESALAFMDDLRTRIEERPQVSTDGLKAYREATWEAFGGDVDFAQIIKTYGKDGEADERKYSPAKCNGMEKIVRMGLAEPGHGEHQLRGTPQPVDAHGDAPLYPAHQRFLKEAGESVRVTVAVFLRRQPREAARARCAPSVPTASPRRWPPGIATRPATLAELVALIDARAPQACATPRPTRSGSLPSPRHKAPPPPWLWTDPTLRLA